MNAPVKIDNIPVGIAFFASYIIKNKLLLISNARKHLLPPDEGLSSRKNGIMFGAKAIGKSRIFNRGSVTLTNTKEF
ncbi:putative traG protein [Rickettsia hoogstraalii str. RCCE3]|nr:putative traG protein [Rickettsia hoogstraalii str. RCCE3]